MVELQKSGGSRSMLLVLLPLVLTAAVYLPTSGGRGVTDYDEGHYSQVALQMLVRGDWVTPYDNGVRFLEKPPLLYWLTAASLRLFGINEFALRLPTALGMLALVWIVMQMARRVAGEKEAMFAGVATAFAVGTYLFTREALHDIWLVVFIAMAMHALLAWYLDPHRSRRYALLFYVACAGAVMTKSLVGIVLPGGIAIVFFLLRRERPQWRSLHLASGSALFLGLTVPWHWLAAVRNQDFLWSFFINEQFLRFIGRHDPPVVWSVPLMTFLALNLVWFFPWTVFLPAAVWESRKPANQSRRALTMLAWTWAAVILVFFSISGRLEHYFFPAIPALALLVAVALSGPDDSKAVRWGFRSLAILGVLMAAVAVSIGSWYLLAGPDLQSVQSVRTDVIAETDFSVMAEMPVSIQHSLIKPALITVIALAAGFGAALWMESRRRRMAAVLCVLGVMGIICMMTQWSMVLCEDFISSKKFGLAVAREASPRDHMVIVGDYESANSVSFYQPLHIEVFDGVAYSLIPGMKFPDAPRIVLTSDEFEALWRGNGRVFVLIPKSRQAELTPGGRKLLEVLDRVLLSNN
jgi:4-amino-4-deoxy-L-arabinose transferase-like glycosyltransferase